MQSYELEEAISKDGEEHNIKKMAKLLINAVNDWPTFNQTRIESFVEELKDYYGYPITPERIHNKKVNLDENQNAYPQEAGESILEKIKISARFENESDFEKIVKRILVHYKNKNSENF